MLVTVLCALAITVPAMSQTLPAGLPQCKSSSSNFTTCLTDAIQKAVDMMMHDGLQEYHIQPLSPLIIGEMDFVIENPFVIVDTPTHLSNVTVAGLDQIKFLSTSTEYCRGKCGLTGVASVPILHITSYFDATLRVSKHPLFNKNGTTNITMYDVRFNYGMDCEKIRRAGEEFFMATNFKISLVPANATIAIAMVDSAGVSDVLMEGAPTWMILDSLDPLISSFMSNVFLTITNKLIMYVPANSVFLP